jgi:hypothetical protein
VTYREAAGHAPADVETLREVVYNKDTYEVHPNPYARWMCPACGLWRWLPRISANSPEHHAGRWVAPDKGVSRGALKRSCEQCGHVWFVEGVHT